MNEPWPIRPNIIRTGPFAFQIGDIFVDDVRFHTAVGNACVHHFVEKELASALQPPHISRLVRVTAGEFRLNLVHLVAERL